ncbi:PREDICTED: uncharacterized protein LOC105368300 [Ceratosolen solmsi marchali]|uniref:Uncharacterized protein LOC105368300 n=1 Tax=Ceratosolen solmsi marchali TaxID=326594 RepID=A0AAJ6YWA8_9HYME|nr:PREDICTED: uncharacterized protein LOC105368300 [Ceratosolen solmsi marchali]
MSEHYFKDIRTIGANIDEGVLKLQEAWKMPHLLLCKSNEEDQIAARNLVENLRSELNILKKTLRESQLEITRLQKIQTQFLDETVEAIRILKEEVEDTKILFAENGYEEEPTDENLVIFNNQLESLSIRNNDSFVKNSDNITETSTYENALLYDSGTNDSVDNDTSITNNVSVGSLQKSLLKEQPVKPVYSPYYYKLLKK